MAVVVKHAYEPCIVFLDRVMISCYGGTHCYTLSRYPYLSLFGETCVSRASFDIKFFCSFSQISNCG